jgi:hypothetical protein
MQDNSASHPPLPLEDALVPHYLVGTGTLAFKKPTHIDAGYWIADTSQDLPLGDTQRVYFLFIHDV